MDKRLSYRRARLRGDNGVYRYESAQFPKTRLCGSVDLNCPGVILERRYRSATGDLLLDCDLTPGSTFEASAHPFAEFSLSQAGDEILRLGYVSESEIEQDGGIAYRCEYAGLPWTLQFFRTPYLQRESYRVIHNGTVILATEILRPFRTAAMTYTDGTIWHCHTELLGVDINDSDGNRVLHTSRRVGLLMGVSSLHIDHVMEDERALPLLLTLTHFTTHSEP